MLIKCTRIVVENNTTDDPCDTLSVQLFSQDFHRQMLRILAALHSDHNDEPASNQLPASASQEL